MKNKNTVKEVYKIIKKIPFGKVVTYAQISKAVQITMGGNNLPEGKYPINPRHVGYLLHNNPDPKTIPCHRVVDRNGNPARNYKFGGIKGQKEKLISEGVKLHKGRVVKEYFAKGGFFAQQQEES